MILVTFINRHTGVLITSENREYFFIIALYIHKFYIDTWYHHIAGNRIAEIYNVGDHLFLFGFNDTVFVTDVNNGQKLILRHSLRLGVGIDAHQVHNSIRKMVDYEDSRGQNTGQPVDDCGIAQCYLLCVDGCCGLRCDLTEN